jgi:hypothetical protein
MNKHLKTIKRYETRDGQLHDDHEKAIRHEYRHAIPNQLANLLKEKCVTDLSKHDANRIVEVLMGDAQNVIEILQDFLENAEAVNEFDAQRERNETRDRMMAAFNEQQANSGTSNA